MVAMSDAMKVAREVAIVKRDLLDAVAGLDLTEAEQRTVEWLIMAGSGRGVRVASIIRKARAAGQSGS